MQKASPTEDSFEVWRDMSRQHSLFSVLNDSMREAFIARCNRVSLDAGQSVFMQGMKHDYSYIIESGSVRTYYVSGTGREVTLSHWSKGDLVGGPLVFGGGKHVWSAVATRPSKVLAISGPDFQDFATLHPQVYAWIVNILGFKLRWLSVLFQIHGTEHVQERLIKLLIMLGENFGASDPRGVVIEQKINQQDLAALVGASRQWTNKTLNHLKKIGLVDMHEKKIILCDVKGLKALLRAG
ncbi:MAG: Crp/Fnr family transcriptional regulator [Hyphomicrobiales bacterium]|nr:Crp/Fnr family transcriptional regulator [Hyphomicrobiales bacterium]